jgi:23S rRNA (cytosine1962-C5)-methyltransferase
MKAIFLKKNEDRRIRKGHLWAFSNEIVEPERQPLNGEVVKVFDSYNNFICNAFYNKNSLIALRALDKESKFDFYTYAKDKILAASQLRKAFYPNRNSYRLVYSEGDFMPGLVIDKYNDTYVLQVHSFGMDKNIGDVVEILKKEFGAVNIFTKNEEYFRTLEGLPTEQTVFLGAMGEEMIDDGSVKYKVSFEEAHKTGFYFDQCDNREFVSKIAEGKTFLDGFCNTGGFGLHAALAGAASVTFVDSSQEAIDCAKVNFELNGFNNQAEYYTEDVFDFLEKCKGENRKFQVVSLDPPAFAKTKKNLENAIKGYEKLARFGVETVEPGGFLIFSSCSFHLKEPTFFEVVRNGANKAGKKIQRVYYNQASLDHPTLPMMEETVYLKFGVFRVL